MTDSLPPALERIRVADRDAELSSAPAQYTYEFGYQGAHLALFEPTTPLPIPAVGQIIELHGYPVKVAAVKVGYENAGPGAPPAVAVTVEVEPVPED